MDADSKLQEDDLEQQLHNGMNPRDPIKKIWKIMEGELKRKTCAFIIDYLALDSVDDNYNLNKRNLQRKFTQEYQRIIETHIEKLIKGMMSFMDVQEIFDEFDEYLFPTDDFVQDYDGSSFHYGDKAL